MRRDPLQAVQRLRRLEVDAARALLIEADQAAQQATRRMQEATAAIQAEMDLASCLDAEDGMVEAFGAWLATGRRTVAEAMAEMARAQASAAQARARMTIARTAAEAVETLLEQKAQAAATEQLSQEQQILDEAGLRRSCVNTQDASTL